jgi:hypothetical protein
MQVMFWWSQIYSIIAQGSREVDNSVGSLTKLLQTSNNALGTSKMEFVNSKPGSLLSIEIPSLLQVHLL